jgi:hypothetical protein
MNIVTESLGKRKEEERMESKRFWIGVDEYLDCTLSSDTVPKWYLKIGELEIRLKDIPGMGDEIQILNLEDHDWKLKDKFIEVTQRVQRLEPDTRIELFGDSFIWDVMKKHTLDFIEGVLDNYDKIKIGDEVANRTGRGIVIGETRDMYKFIEYGTGKVGAFPKTYPTYKKPTYKKTGKHFDVIEKYCKGEE